MDAHSSVPWLQLSVQISITPSAPHSALNTHTLMHKHTAPEKLVTRSSPITETCMYAHILTHTLLTESERRRHLLKGVFDGSSMSHYAHLHHTATLTHSQTHTHSGPNKQTRLEDNRKAPGFKT